MPSLLRTLAALALVSLVGCGTEAPSPDAAPAPNASAPALGPLDGADLAPTALDRIAVGDPAPDFRLASYRGDTLQLSEFEGAREIILVFYRGAW